MLTGRRPLRRRRATYSSLYRRTLGALCWPSAKRPPSSSGEPISRESCFTAHVAEGPEEDEAERPDRVTENARRAQRRAFSRARGVAALTPVREPRPIAVSCRHSGHRRLSPSRVGAGREQTLCCHPTMRCTRAGNCSGQLAGRAGWRHTSRRTRSAAVDTSWRGA